jgi:hypothetical protein
MLLPSKHIRLSESILGIGALVLEALNEPMTLDALKTSLDARVEREQLSSQPSLEMLVLALNFLFAVSAITTNDNGAIARCASSP